MRPFIFLAVITCFSLNLSAQNDIKVLRDSLPVFEGVISVPNKTSNEIYSLLKEWVVKNYNSPNSVIQMDNPELLKLIVKGLSTYNLTTMGVSFPNKTFHMITFETKDGRFKYTIEYTEVTTGTADEQILKSVLLNDPPLKPNGEPYGGIYLKNVLKQKQEHIKYLLDFKNNVISSIVQQVQSKKDNNTW